MSLSTIRVRYAKAFYALAKEQNLLDVLKTDIQRVAEVCSQSIEFIELLESPVVKTSKKIFLITKIFSTEVNQLTINFLTLITRNKREAEIPGICRNFIDLVRKDQNIKTASVITATEIGNELTSKIKLMIEKELQVTIELSSKINPNIIGGLILRVDDKQYDSSIATQLKKVKEKLLETEV